MKRFLEVLWLDLKEVPRRPLFWVLLLILGFMAFGLSNGNAQIQSGDVRVGGARAWLTSEFAQTQYLMLIVSLLYSFFASIAAGMIFIRDEENKVGPLLHSTPLTPAQYVWGKYTAVLVGFFGVLAPPPITMAFQHLMPHGAKEAIGPFVRHTQTGALFAVPMIVLVTGTSFARR
jgi:ABC-type transport system involved in multi-copper enzyme maturation permease subunit